MIFVGYESHLHLILEYIYIYDLLYTYIHVLCVWVGIIVLDILFNTWYFLIAIICWHYIFGNMFINLNIYNHIICIMIVHDNDTHWSVFIYTQSNVQLLICGYIDYVHIGGSFWMHWFQICILLIVLLFDCSYFVN